MTDKMIAQAKRDLAKRAAEIRGEDGGLSELWPFFTDEMRREEDELWCREMVMACICYGTEYDFYDEKTSSWGMYGLPYAESLGKKRALEIFRDQRDYMKEHAKIHRGVHTDFEGCTYNSIEWV
jgi:hypothetical protein